jgi:hypothetical protein
MKTLETKYLPGECLKLSEETIAKQFPGQENAGRQLDLKVLAVGTDGYVLGQYVAVGPAGMAVAGPQFFKTDDVNKELVAVECPAYLAPKVEPTDPEAE